MLLGPWRETTASGQINILLFGLIMTGLLIKRNIWPHRAADWARYGHQAHAAGLRLYFLVRGDWCELRNMASGFVASLGLGYLIHPAESRTN